MSSIVELDDETILIEHVAARVNFETGARFFAPETVERIQQIGHSRPQSQRVIETVVFDFVA